jgi:alanine racemase
MVNSNNETLEVGDEVVLIGEQEGQSITVEEMSGWVETIPYEILTNLNDRIPRIYSNG